MTTCSIQWANVREKLMNTATFMNKSAGDGPHSGATPQGEKEDPPSAVHSAQR